MPQRIRIVLESHVFQAELNDTRTARALADALPLEGRANRWGDEIYFNTSVRADSDDPQRSEMQIGELAFWPAGQAFCIFWGPTPASEGNEPRAVSDVVPVGRICGPTDGLDEVTDGMPIRIESA